MNDVIISGDASAKVRLIQPIDARDSAMIGDEFKMIRQLSGREDILLCAFPAESWNDCLSPWPAAAVFGRDGFGGKGKETLDLVTGTLIPRLDAEYGIGAVYMIGGYSLAGLFALWASYQTDLFAGVAAVSPSVWYPGWTEFSFAHNTLAKRVYLSLGDKEEKTKNAVMARVGDAVRKQYRVLSSMSGVESVLEWNEGNHFRDPALRTAKGFAWLLKEK